MRLFKTSLMLLWSITVFSQTFNEKVTSSLGISISFPGTPTFSQTRDNNIGTYNYTYNYSLNGSNFVFQINQLISPVTERDLVDGKDLVANNFVKSANGYLINSRVISKHNRRCIEFTFNSFLPTQRINRSHAYVFKNHLIIVTYSSEIFKDELFSRFTNTLVFP
jgi:hypothetical protein